MHQVSKPRAAKKSIADESGRPGTCRSNVGWEAIDEPWTKRIVPFASRGATALFRHRNNRTSPLRVQCSVLRTVAVFACSFISTSLAKFSPKTSIGLPVGRFPASCAKKGKASAIFRCQKIEQSEDSIQGQEKHPPRSVAFRSALLETAERLAIAGPRAQGKREDRLHATRKSSGLMKIRTLIAPTAVDIPSSPPDNVDVIVRFDLMQQTRLDPWLFPVRQRLSKLKRFA